MRYVYLDFKDYRGLVDISDYVDFDTLTYTINNCNDSFMRSANTCDFTVISAVEMLTVSLTPAITGLAICGMTIVGAFEEEGQVYLPEDIAVYVYEGERSEVGSELLFKGHTDVLRNTTYNGIVDLETLTFSATDSSDKFYKTVTLDSPADEIIIDNAYVLNWDDKPNSAVHQLCYALGFDDSIISEEVNILDQIEIFAPDIENKEIGSILDTMLYECGYTFKMDASDQLHPAKWMYTEEDTPTFTFDDTNILDTININEAARAYDGVKFYYYNIGKGITTADSYDIKLFHDSNLPTDGSGNFEGYYVLAGYKYPPETNVIDSDTEDYTQVFQEYDDTSIKYWTNYGIITNSDYNYKSFDSDFSEIIATEDVYLDYSAEDGIEIVTQNLYNKKAEIVFNNPTASNLKLYWLDLYGKVWYRTAKRTVEVDIISDPYKYKEYTATYITDDTKASTFAKYLASIINLKSAKYTFKSQSKVAEGSFVFVELGDGTLQKCLITKRTYEESRDDRYSYALLAISNLSWANGVTRKSVTQNPVSAALNNYEMQASPTSLSIPTNEDGTRLDTSNALITLSVLKDSSTDVTESWTLDATADSAITGSFVDTNKYRITGLTSSPASIVFTATRNSRTLTKTVSVSSVATLANTASQGGYLGVISLLSSLPETPIADSFFLAGADFDVYEIGHIYKYSGTVLGWSEIAPSSSEYGYYASLVSADALNLAASSGQVILAASAFIDNLSSNTAFIDNLFSNELRVYNNLYNTTTREDDAFETGDSKIVLIEGTLQFWKYNSGVWLLSSVLSPTFNSTDNLSDVSMGVSFTNRLRCGSNAAIVGAEGNPGYFRGGYGYRGRIISLAGITTDGGLYTKLMDSLDEDMTSGGTSTSRYFAITGVFSSTESSVTIHFQVLYGYRNLSASSFTLYNLPIDGTSSTYPVAATVHEGGTDSIGTLAGNLFLW